MKLKLLVFCLLPLAAKGLTAQVPYDQKTIRPNEQLTWTTLPWSGDDRPYKAIRSNIDNAIQRGQNLDEIVRKYRRLAQQDLLNPLPQFAWAYVSYRASVQGAKLEGELQLALKQLNNFKTPYTYEYARLLFILEARSWPRSKLILAGRKLIQRNPKDYSVLYYLVKIMDPGRSVSERLEAISYSERLVQMEPKRANAYSALGYTYLKSWLKSKSKSDRDKALSAYNRFLNLAPLNDSFRPQAIRIISLLKK